MLNPFKLTPIYKDYIWGGKRLRPHAEITAEAWIVSEDNIVTDGNYAGQTLGKVAELESNAFLGTRVVSKAGNRFPLLIKLLDCSKWLSLQVHPNNEQAEHLEGANHFGKTEAWYIIDAEKDSQLISGFHPGVSQKEILQAVGNNKILDLVERKNVQSGDTIFIAPGTIHALGSGMLIYEVQQNSDITYRVYDWDRPMADGRKLHIKESASVLNPNSRGEVLPKSLNLPSNPRKKLVSCEFFTLEQIAGYTGPVEIDFQKTSFSVLTVIKDSVSVCGTDWAYQINPLETLIIPAICGSYWVKFSSEACVLMSHCAK
jgi:mannose-6-phosphate isomerase